MSGRPDILHKYAAAAAQGEQDRADRLSGRVDGYDLLLRRQSEMRKAVGFWRLQRNSRGRLDPCLWEWVAADLRDDGAPDWTYWLDNFQRRYRVRPWRETDGSPFAYSRPCITICDCETGRTYAGVPSSGLRMLGLDVPLQDTDEFAATYILASARAGGSA